MSDAIPEWLERVPEFPDFPTAARWAGHLFELGSPVRDEARAMAGRGWRKGAEIHDDCAVKLAVLCDVWSQEQHFSGRPSIDDVGRLVNTGTIVKSLPGLSQIVRRDESLPSLVKGTPEFEQAVQWAGILFPLAGQMVPKKLPEWRDRAITVAQALLAKLAETRQSPTRHSTDFRSVHWHGVDYTFTAIQAACVTVLWAAWENGTPDVAGITLLDKAGSARADRSGGKLKDLFKGHPAWMTIIGEGETKGAYRLIEQEN